MTGSEVDGKMKRSEPKGNKIFRWIITGILILSAVVMMLPLYYLVVTSFKTMQEAIGPFHWWPQTRTLDNFREVFEMEQFHIIRFFFNTIFLILVKSLATILTLSLIHI